MLPFITLWVALSIFYMFMPNTKIRLSAGLIAGIISGTIWQVFNWAYLKFQIGITRYNAIYGTFATVPIFMVWLYTSWIVILLGAELGFVFQNRKKLRKAPNAENPSLLELEELLITLKFIVKRFQEGKFPLKYEDITTHSDLAKENLSRVIEYLKKRKILTQKEEEIYFLKNPAQVKLSEIILPSHYQENDKILQIIDKITNKEALDSCAITDLI